MTPTQELSELIEELRTLRLFLNGEGTLEGSSFGERRFIAPGIVSTFWWRGALSRIDQAVQHLSALKGEDQGSAPKRFDAQTDDLVTAEQASPQPPEAHNPSPERVEKVARMIDRHAFSGTDISTWERGGDDRRVARAKAQSIDTLYAGEIETREAYREELAAVMAMLDRYHAPALDDADGKPLSPSNRIEALVYERALTAAREFEVKACLAQLTEAEARIRALEAEKEDARAALAIVRQSLREQAAARADPTMPRLTSEVLAKLEGEAEAAWALAEDQEDRVAAHGLSLLCDWQRQALGDRS